MERAWDEAVELRRVRLLPLGLGGLGDTDLEVLGPALTGLDLGDSGAPALGADLVREYFFLAARTSTLSAMSFLLFEMVSRSTE